MITTSEVEHIAKLSRLQFNNVEIENFKNDLNQIVDYVNELQKIDTSSVSVKLNAVDAETTLRSDEPKTPLSQESAVLNAPQKHAGAIVVPIVIE